MTINESRRIIFLDIDGVLNSTRSCIAYNGMPSPLEPKTWKYFDPVAVNLIKSVIKELKAEAIISSSWSRYINLSNLNAYLDIEIKDKIDLNIEPNNRGCGIEAYIKDIIPNIDSYVIIDVIIDDIPVNYLTRHQTLNRRVVTVNFGEGYSLENYLVTIDILSTPLSQEEIDYHLHIFE